MRSDSKTGGRQAPENVRTYRDYTDDFVESKDQEITLPDGYTWIHRNIFYRAASGVLYAGGFVYAYIYTKFVLHIKVVNRRVLTKYRNTGYFLFGNHTQPIGDPSGPYRYTFPKRSYFIMSPSNLGIPVLGRFLPMFGGLPLPDSYSGMKEFIEAVRYHIEHKRCIVIFPEAHLWPWCSFIRPFPDTSFRFPVMLNVPSFCMTVTYQESRKGRKPGVTVYIDGPFYPDTTLGAKAARKDLHDRIFACMQERSRNSTCEYIKYVKEP